MTLEALQQFVSIPLEAVLDQHRRVSPEARALELFHSVAATVSAYRDFLAKRGIEVARIRDFEAFRSVPLTTKQNYMLAYALPELCREGRIGEMIAVSSGSTGKPLFWPRSLEHELEIARRFEQVFHGSFQADSRSTLVVVCFALGAWVGGMYTAACCRYLARKGYRLTLVTPGNNKSEIFRVVNELAPHFEQLVLAGYPPFIKEVVDSGIALGIDCEADSGGRGIQRRMADSGLRARWSERSIA